MLKFRAPAASIKQVATVAKGTKSGPKSSPITSRPASAMTATETTVTAASQRLNRPSRRVNAARSPAA